MRTLLLSLQLLALAVGLTACGSDTLSLDPVASAAAKTVESGSSRVEFTASMKAAGESIDMSGSGAFDYRRSRGQATYRMQLPMLGDVSMEMRMVGTKVFLRLPQAVTGGMTGGKEWIGIDVGKALEQAGLGSLDFTQQQDPAQTLQYLRPRVPASREAGNATVRGVETTRYTGRLDFRKALDAGIDGLELPAAERQRARQGMQRMFDQLGANGVPFEVFVDDDGLLRRMTMDFMNMAIEPAVVDDDLHGLLRLRRRRERAPPACGRRLRRHRPPAPVSRPRAQSRRPRSPTLSRVQETLSVPNEVAAELAGVGDGVLDALRARLSCTLRLRGNELTIEGEDDSVAAARAVVDELVELVEGGHEIGPDTVGAVVAALDQAEDIREVFDDVVWRHRGKKIAPKTVTQKRYVDSIRECTVTFGIGPAGTGKTYLAIALAVAALTEKQVGRIILTRPAIEAGERLGFLPGDMLAKVDPYMRPLFDALYDMMDPDRLAAYMERGTVEVAPLAFMRGRTLNDSFIILDEAQNTSPEQMQMFLTRLGFGSKVVVTGDVTQIDLPRDQASGLIQVRDILSSIDGIGFVEFSHQDVVRHKLVQRIVEAYKLHAEETGTARKR